MADGTTKNAICRSPPSSRLAQVGRPLASRSRPRSAMAGSSAAETDIPKRLTGSV